VIRYFLRRTWGSREIDEVLWAYACLTAQQPGAEHAPLSFLSAALFSADIHDVYEAVRAPVLVVHGTRGDFTDYLGLPLPGVQRPWQVHVMQGTGALPYFERLPEFLSVWRDFVASVGHAVRPRRGVRPPAGPGLTVAPGGVGPTVREDGSRGDDH
jgi:hypothetical protein